MFNLRAIAFKLFRAAATQILTSIGIIAISVCLVMTMGVYIWNAKAQLDADIYALFGDADMTVGYNPEQHQWITTEQLQTMANIEGVKKVSPILFAETNVEGTLSPIHTIGVENDSLVKSRYHFKSDIEKNEVIVSEKIASIFQKTTGDIMDINNSPYFIKEILEPSQDNLNAELLILTNDTVRQWIDFSVDDVGGLFTLIELKEKGSTSLVSQQLFQLDEELQIDSTNKFELIHENFQALVIFIIVLSVFVLLITTMLLLSTFQLVFYKLNEQLMVLRTLGATTRQVGKIVQIQLFIMITTGVIVGTLLSAFVVKMLLPFLIRKMQLPEAETAFPFVLVISIAIGTFALLLAMTHWQIQKSMRLLPLQIATENQQTTVRLTTVKQYGIGFLLACALLIMFSAIFEQSSAHRALQILLSSLLLCSVVLYLMPFFFSRLLHFVLQPVRKFLGKEAFLACQQLMPQVRNSMPVVLSIIGLMVIVILGTSLFKTVIQTEEMYIDSIYETPVVVHNDLHEPTLTLDTIQEIEALPTVDYAYAKSDYPQIKLFLNKQWAGENYKAVDVKKFIDVGKLQKIEGDFENGIIVSEQFAMEHDLHNGDWLQAAKYNVEMQMNEELEPVQIVGITDLNENVPILIDWSSPITEATDAKIDKIMVETSEIEETTASLQFLYEKWPSLTISDEQTFANEIKQMSHQRWSLFIGIMTILVGATILGVIQTLMHTIYKKRNDYAIQRLIGLSPNGLVKLILTQVLTFVLYGLTIGIIIGFLFTQLLGSIDTGVSVRFDLKTLMLVISFFLLSICTLFALQGRWISRKTLANELSDS